MKVKNRRRKKKEYRKDFWACPYNFEISVSNVDTSGKKNQITGICHSCIDGIALLVRVTNVIFSNENGKGFMNTQLN